ncbi:hypothetical protein VDF71_19455 [Xanthomonas campestris pv. raphani]|uniref:hypothetical protein n=1 Tax=Xanthomonas campestris TaxID=339 RepID=UPI002B233BE4|nr:hypothetical protein [Xanthomonas campestris]MEA9773401.1 hypothetical protein [Xanthomonas campestris pv. raphani]MEA9801571.1 hypothetical protein [Xanthomonas campestris pv. raphani]
MSSDRFSEEDLNQLDVFLGKTLDRLQANQLSKGDTVGLLAELISKVDIDNRADARYWLQNPDCILDEACETVDN